MGGKKSVKKKKRRIFPVRKDKFNQSLTPDYKTGENKRKGKTN